MKEHMTLNTAIRTEV